MESRLGMAQGETGRDRDSSYGNKSPISMGLFLSSAGPQRRSSGSYLLALSSALLSFMLYTLWRLPFHAGSSAWPVRDEDYVVAGPSLMFLLPISRPLYRMVLMFKISV